MRQISLKKMTIPQIIILGFMSVILTGTLLLMLPISSQSGQVTPFLDALFTATSAVCVTGQVVVNTAEHWTYFGKTVIIILIEIGGLGFMTMIVLLFLFVGKKLNLRQRRVIQESLNLDDISEASRLVRYVIRFALGVQLLGAIVLSTILIPQYGWLKGIYFSLFHSISAFCNAGFDLFGDSLISYQNNPLMLVTIGSLIMIGGLGFIVWRDLLTFKRNRKLLIHTKLVLITTGIILFGSMFLLWVSESKNGTFAHVPLDARWANYFFLAVTPRTAGYANIDYRLVSHFGLMMTIVLMFIGGSSGSTAGGIKVTTLAVLAIFAKSSMRGEEPIFANRSIPKDRILKAVYIIIFGVTMVITATFILLLTETIPPGFGLEYILIEVVSCFGTVGLTMGLTPDLTSIGKLVLIILMFVGRIGLLTVFWSSTSSQKEVKLHHPEANIFVG